MKTVHQMLCLALSFLIAGVIGYCLQALHDRPVSALTSSGKPDIDYFLTARSFSEVENARSLTEALAVRTLQELRARRIGTGRPSVHSASRTPLREEQLNALVQDFHSALQEFRGTEQELLLLQDLLWLHKREGDHSEWVRLYLDALYRHPTHPIIGRLSEEALVVSKTAQREQELLDALNHLERIPIQFESKHLVQATLARATDTVYLAHTDNPSSDTQPNPGFQ